MLLFRREDVPYSLLIFFLFFFFSSHTNTTRTAGALLFLYLNVFNLLACPFAHAHVVHISIHTIYIRHDRLYALDLNYSYNNR